jgi:AcrR family transcriptional regulator
MPSSPCKICWIDLLDRAGIGRSTFYTHYYDKEDVLASIVEQMLAMFRQQIAQRDAGQALVPSLELFQHVYQHPQPQRFQAMLRGHAGELLRETGQALLIRNIEQTLATASAGACSPTVPLPVIAQYLAGAFFGLFKWWLEADMPYTPEQMDAIFQQLALPGVRAALRTSAQRTKLQSATADFVAAGP